MLPRLEYIKQARVRLGITQRKLASLTGVSTSMINQIESGRCKPSYDTARKIFEVLGSLEGKTSMKAGDICSRNLIHVQKDERLYKAIELMRKNSISQIPVFDASKVVGILTEDGLAKIMVEKDEMELKDVRVAQVMESPPPQVDVSTPAKALVPLVRFTRCVLVSEKANVIGIVTITDTLKWWSSYSWSFSRPHAQSAIFMHSPQRLTTVPTGSAVPHKAHSLRDSSLLNEAELAFVIFEPFWLLGSRSSLCVAQKGFKQFSYEKETIEQRRK